MIALCNSSRQNSDLETILVEYIIFITLFLVGISMATLNRATYFQFPQPTGNYAVGRTSFHLIDQHRKELYKPEANEPRELMITAWYPAAAAHNKLSCYAPGYLMDSIKNLFKSFEGITQEDLSEFDTLRVYAAPDAPIANGTPFPLIIFSHGYYGSRFYCSALCEELASHGYIVIAPDHTYDAGITELPGGRIATCMQLTDAPIASDAFYDTFTTRIEVRVADIRFILDCVEQKKEALFSLIDMNNVGIFGHSLGAEAGLQAAARDERIKAVAAMDPFPMGKSIAGSRTVPCMTFAAELTDWSKLECSKQVHAHIADRIKELEKLCTYHVVLKGADHVVYSDFALFNSMNIFKKLPQNSPHMFSIGSIDGFEAITLIRKYLVAFFGKTLKDEKPMALNKETDN